MAGGIRWWVLGLASCIMVMAASGAHVAYADTDEKPGHRQNGDSRALGKKQFPREKVNVTLAVRKAWHGVVQWPQSCESAFDYPDKNFGGMRFYEMAQGRFLIEVICTLGSYQGYQMYYYLDEEASEIKGPLSFPVYQVKDGKFVKGDATELWGTADFDAATKTLKMLNRYSGFGDCGMLVYYLFDGAVPRLGEVRAKEFCDGRAEEPEKWDGVQEIPVR